MPARTGQAYLDSINRQQRDVWIHGERVSTGVGDHPALQRLCRTYAALYDMQHDPGLREEMTYASPTTGDRVGLSFLQPATRADLVRRRTAMSRWHQHSGGLLGRTADYLNSAVMAMAGAAPWFAAGDPRFGDHIAAYYEYIRERDLLLTHTLITPQANRAAGPAEQKDPHLAAAVVDRNQAGIVIRGARLLATLGPIADEIMVFPSTVLKSRPEDAPYAYAFAIPCDTPGLRFLCRESLDYGRSRFDHPLGSRFEEMDSIVVFNDVLVPWERVFMLDRPDLCNDLYTRTNAVVHMTHQVVTRNVAKLEFLLGLVCSMVDAIGIDQFQHVHEKVSEVIVALESMRAFLRASEADAEPNAWGIMTPAWGPLNAARNWFPRTFPRLVEIVQQLGASGLMAIPTEADFSSPMRPDLERYLQSAALDARERVQLFRLAWDYSCSAFAGRQVLYERFFFGDPVRMAGALYHSYDRQPYKDRVRAFLNRDD